MLRPLRFVIPCTVVLLFAAIAGAQDPAAASAATPLPPDIQAELDALQARTWHPSASAKASVGWRDNIMLSRFAPLARAFGRGEVEAVVLRPMRDRWQFISFLNGDVLRYFSPPVETAGEQQWSLHAEGRWQPIEPARLALKATGYITDMVIDLSETEVQRVVAPTVVHGAYVVAATRLALPAGFRLEPSVQVKRSDYRDYAGDYDEVRSGARLEWSRSDALVLSAAWFEARRDYAQRANYTASGRLLPGTRLSFARSDREVKARVAWRDWWLAVTAGELENRDGASGYSDYDQKRGRLEVEWRRAAWRVSLDAEAKRMDYLVQTVGAGIAPPPRIADDFETTLRAERELDPRWTVFAEHRWERSRSNEDEFSYRANTVLAGVQRAF